MNTRPRLQQFPQRFLLLVILASAGGWSPGMAQATLPAAIPDSTSLARAARSFLVAFDSLRWEPFAAAWAPEASVFPPDPDQPQLIDGREAVLAFFRTLFADVRAEAKTQAPALGILPSVRDLRIRMLGPQGALVTFELGRGPTRGRRTILWRWEPSALAWQIIHLHASRLSSE